MSDYSTALDELVEQGILPVENNKVKEESTDTIITNEIERITGTSFSSEQRKCIEHRGSCVILACAGSGKTSVLTNMLAKRIWNREIVDTNKVICTTYSKAGADEMNVRLGKLLDTLGIKCNLEIRTLHSFFYSLIRTFGITGYKIISSGVRAQYIKESCKEAGYICKDDDLVIIDNLISYRVNNLLNDAKTLRSPACTLADLTEQQFKEIRQGYDFKKAQNNYMDFDDMQLYIYKWVCVDTKSDDENVRNTGNAVRNYCRAMYNEFYIDEAQDVSVIQYAIIKSIVTSNDTGMLDRTLVFMGDDDQCIYKWRGAAPEIILTIGSKMNMANFVLSNNYRCYSEIVDFAGRSIKYNNSRYNKSMVAYRRGGQVEIYQANSNDLYDLSRLGYDKVMELINDGCKKSDIAILCRNNAHLSLLNVMLVRQGIYSNIPDEMKLTKTYIYNDIKGVLMIASNSFSGKVTGQLLWKLCSLMTANISRRIGTFQEDNGLNVYDTLTYIANRILKKDSIKVSDSIVVNSKSEQKLTYAMARIKNEAIVSMLGLIEIMSIQDEKERTRKLIAIYIANTEFIYKNTDKRRIMRGTVHFINSIIVEKGINGTMAELRGIEQLENSNFKPPRDSIRMCTIHGAKGREWKNVILFACDNEAIPGMSGISKMVEEQMPMSDIYDTIDEERRLYYVACTRAKEKLQIITGIHPSVFLMESLGKYADVDGSTNGIIVDISIGEEPPIMLNNGIIHNSDIETEIETLKRGQNE